MSLNEILGRPNFRSPSFFVSTDKHDESRLMDNILLVEDKAELREMLVTALARMGYEAVPAAGVPPALAALATTRLSAVLTDLKLPGGSGMDVLRASIAADASVPVVIMTAYGSIAEAVDAMREGAYDFIQKPIDLEYLKHLLARAMERQELVREVVVLREEYARKFGFPRIVGDHPSMQVTAREMQRIATTDSTVLLLGESGTGKELFARAIHQLSARASKPMVTINCAAIPETLVENELFGHEKGAFTGALQRKPGKFEVAHHGTLFLDEIGELPLSAQGKLLRAIEEKKIDRLGGAGEITVDVRVVAATNRDLESAVEAGEFRRDLYYRLAVFPIRIPALRERGEDVVLLAEHFLERFRKELRKPRMKFAPDALSALCTHNWPGNVRELQNVIERAAILNEGDLHAADLALSMNVRAGCARTEVTAFATPSAEGSLAEVSSQAVRQVERAKIEATLRECKWNKAATAQRLGVSYKTLLTKIHAYDLD
ncbi:MAG TPA: sigma-54 dependent transcriptional regulator [Clostridia bacterium]|nr:sigma-54 dependent transcriptional regulator [Clostridia bacterium]